MVFTTPSGPTVTVTAWYVNGSELEPGTLGQYSSGLGVCDTSNCSGNQQLGEDEFLLFQFSAPIDPTSITTLESNGKLGGLSYWLGSTTSQSINLTKVNMDLTTSLSNLGFGSKENSTGGMGSTQTIDFGGAPTTSVNAILFGAMYGYSGEDFDVSSISGGPVAASVPEPASIFLLFPVAVTALGLCRREHSRRIS